MDYPPMVIILRFLEWISGFLNFSKVSIPALTDIFLSIIPDIIGSINFPDRKDFNKSTSLLENKQFFNFPSAVSRILLQVSQKGFVTVLIIPKEAFNFLILKSLAMKFLYLLTLQ